MDHRPSRPPPAFRPTLRKPPRKAAKNPLHQQLLESRISELKSQMSQGGVRECLIRAALYVGMARGSVDERGFELIRRIRATHVTTCSLPKFKALLRDQFFMLVLDQETALAAIPSMLPADADERRRALALLRKVVSARGELSGEVAKRMERVVGLFEAEGSPSIAPTIAHLKTELLEERSMAS